MMTVIIGQDITSPRRYLFKNVKKGNFLG